MFQTYEPSESGGASGERIERLRELMARARIDALLVPHGDEYANEYLPACAERLAFVTGFTGSAGTAIVAKDGAALFVDGRYILQAPRQVDTKIFEVLQVGKAKLGEWLAKTLKPGAVIGFDPKLHPPSTVDDLAEELASQRIKLKPLAGNLVDRLWGRQRPPPPQGAVVVHPVKYAGKSAEDKLGRDPGRPEEGRAGCRRAHLPAVDLLASQHPRLRRGPQSGGAGVRHRAGERQSRAVHRSGQDRPGGQGAPGACGQAQRSRGVWASV